MTRAVPTKMMSKKVSAQAKQNTARKNLLGIAPTKLST